MTAAVRITDEERRARLVARHRLGRTAPDVLDAVRSVVALHSTDPATPYLAARARLSEFVPDDLDRALFTDRSLWRLHAMRRTLFIVPAADGPVVQAAAAGDVARQERRRLEGWLRSAVDPDRVADLLTRLEQDVLEVMVDGVERLTRELTAMLPELGMEITLGSGRWTAQSPISSRLLFLMAMDGRIVRTRPAGSWRSSQYRWADTSTWFGKIPAPMAPEPARTELARNYLGSHGPATLEDLRWWTGWGARQAAAAVAGLGAVAARLDDNREGLLLPHDVEPAPAVAGQVAFLPALDPTPMGWKERGWFLGSHAGHLFDRSGNIGPSVWVDGRIVGGWAQRPDGEVIYRLFEDVGAGAARRLEDEAAELTRWMGGAVAIPRFRTPLERELSGR